MSEFTFLCLKPMPSFSIFCQGHSLTTPSLSSLIGGKNASAGHVTVTRRLPVPSGPERRLRILPKSPLLACQGILF